MLACPYYFIGEFMHSDMTSQLLSQQSLQNMISSVSNVDRVLGDVTSDTEQYVPEHSYEDDDDEEEDSEEGEEAESSPSENVPKELQTKRSQDPSARALAQVSSAPVPTASAPTARNPKVVAPSLQNRWRKCPSSPSKRLASPGRP